MLRGRIARREAAAMPGARYFDAFVGTARANELKAGAYTRPLYGTS